MTLDEVTILTKLDSIPTMITGKLSKESKKQILKWAKEHAKIDEEKLVDVLHKIEKDWVLNLPCGILTKEIVKANPVMIEEER